MARRKLARLLVGGFVLSLVVGALVTTRAMSTVRGSSTRRGVKACLDVFDLGTQPEFLGEPIPVRVAPR